MKYPCLIQKRFCKTDIEVRVNREGRKKYGEPLEQVQWSGKCNYQDNGKTVLTAEKQLIQLSGCALIPGDIAPELPSLSGGELIVNGVKRRIYEGTKARNPDGTVNYTRLEVE